MGNQLDHLASSTYLSTEHLDRYSCLQVVVEQAFAKELLLLLAVVALLKEPAK